MTRLQAWLVCIAAVLMADNAPLVAQRRARQQPVTAVMPGDEVWLISARGDAELEHSSCPSETLRCQRYANGCWQESHCLSIPTTIENEQRETLVFVHGYNTDLHFAQKRGLEVYQNLLGSVANRPPVRYVIWAWKSEREFVRPIRDYTDKSKKAVKLGNKFAWTLNLLGPKPAVVLGYSLGSQIAVSALAQSSLYQGPPIQLAAIGAANDCCFASCQNLLENQCRIRRTVVFVNHRDRAIRAAETICRVRFKQQFTSLDELAPRRTKYFGQVDIIDITEVASRRHGITRYTALPSVQTYVKDLLQSNHWLPSPCASPLGFLGDVPNVIQSQPVVDVPATVIEQLR